MKRKKNDEQTEREKKFQEIKKTLLHQKELLLSGAENTRHSMPTNSNLTEIGDQASVEIDMNFTLRLKGRERQLLKKIDVALDKIEQGTYGKCEGCGKDIDLKRLQARPVTNMCIECKTEQEEEEKLRER
ncbi:MAG: TraR/DksA C4-type zinc finger protein [Thermodesulfovibrionales bacterium]|nr:TraR/DksA C4-type zinc finger protein [Thermodesulfovibrionales bacterium]